MLIWITGPAAKGLGDVPTAWRYFAVESVSCGGSGTGSRADYVGCTGLTDLESR